jgi:hypothetical protein
MTLSLLPDTGDTLVRQPFDIRSAWAAPPPRGRGGASSALQRDHLRRTRLTRRLRRHPTAMGASQPPQAPPPPKRYDRLDWRASGVEVVVGQCFR